MRTSDVFEIVRKETRRELDRRPNYAYVHAVDGIRADIRLPSSNAIVKNVIVIGSASGLIAGERVQISWWDNDRPVVVASIDNSDFLARLSLLESLVAGLMIPEGDSAALGGGDVNLGRIILIGNGSSWSFEPTAVGLLEAFSQSVLGMTVIVPTGTISGNFTIPAGVMVVGFGRENTIIAGEVTGSDGASIESLKVENSVSSGDDVYALVGTISGIFEVYDVVANACNQGAGDAYGIYQPTGGDTNVNYSTLRGEAYGGGLGYAGGIESSSV
jgi:hypothetical protein